MKCVKLPADLPEGQYTAQVCDDTANARQELRDNPHLGMPTTLEHLMKAVQTVASGRRTLLFHSPMRFAAGTPKNKPRCGSML